MKGLKEIEKLADNVCAECLVSKHSAEYQRVVNYIAEFCGYEQGDIVFIENNRIVFNNPKANEKLKVHLPDVIGCKHKYHMVGHQFNGHYECEKCGHQKSL